MAQMTEAKPKMLDTGVPNLDRVLGGGLQQHNSYLFVGASGTGKSALTQQIIFYRAQHGDRVLLITGLEEPHHNLLEHLSTFRFVDFKLVGPQIETVSMVPFLDRPVSDKIDVLRRTVLNARPRLVLMDGLRSAEAFLEGAQGMYQFLYSLTSWFAVERITLLLTKTTSATEDADNPETGLIDGVVVMTRELVDGHSMRRLWVRKMRGQKPLDGLHSFTIDENGVTVWPRPQATLRLQDRPWSDARAPFGMPTLDPMLGGGLPEATTTLLAGGPGTGKTLLALAFLSQGAQQGQPGLWLGFRETRSRLLGPARDWSRALADAEANGQAEFITLPPLDLDPDQLAGLLQERVAALGAKRLVLDAAEALEQALPTRRSATAFMTWLVQFLLEEGITGLITRQLPAVEGRGLAVTATPLSYLADNVILLGHHHEQAQRRHVLSILKMRGSGYDPTIREYTLDEHGITVGEPLALEAG